MQHKALGELLAERNDDFLAGYLDDDVVGGTTTSAELVPAGRAAAEVHPVYFGSAMTGVGVTELDRRHPFVVATSNRSVPSEPLQARVFKVERGAGR